MGSAHRSRGSISMLALLAVLYLVRTISLPAGMAVDLSPPEGPWTVQDHYWGPSGPGIASLRTIALSRTGSVGVIVYPQGRYVQPGHEILILRPDGSHVVLTTPPEEELAKTFRQAAIVNGESVHPGAYFVAIRFARDGTPFATVAWNFSGAFSGSDKAVFEWNGSKWVNALPADTPLDWTNVGVGAADMPWRAAYNVDYSNTFPALDEVGRVPHYQEFWTFLGDGEHQARLGYGASMGMNGSAVVGYSAGLASVSQRNLGPCRAWAWLGSELVQLGPGVAYSINASHDIVGDDEEAIGAKARPVLWHDRTKIVLSGENGSALAIADDGTIVGRLGEEGFIVRGGDPTRKVVRIDALLRPQGWHVSAVYGVASSGRLLAVGHRNSEAQRVLILDPQ